MASATQSSQEKPAAPPKDAPSTTDGIVPKKEGNASSSAGAATGPDAADTTRKSKKSNPSSSTLTKATNNPTTPAVTQPQTTTNGAPNGGGQPSKKPKRSFWKGFRSFLLPCIPGLDGGKAHDIEVGTGASSKTAASGTGAAKEVPGEEKRDLDEKAAAKTDATTASTPHIKTGSSGKAIASDAPSTPSKTKPTPSALTVPPAPVENDGDVTVVVPPSPKSHLLPREETEGVTSGAVQPPGGTGVGAGESNNLLHPPTGAAHSHTHTHTGSGTITTDSDVSITDENEGDVADNEGSGNGLANELDVEDEDDEEERLILAGGTGIPIGPVSYLFRFSRDAFEVLSIFELSGRQTVSSPSALGTAP